MFKLNSRQSNQVNRPEGQTRNNSRQRFVATLLLFSGISQWSSAVFANPPENAEVHSNPAVVVFETAENSEIDHKTTTSNEIVVTTDKTTDMIITSETTEEVNTPSIVLESAVSD